MSLGKVPLKADGGAKRNAGRAGIQGNDDKTKGKGKLPCDHHVLCEYRPRGDTKGNSFFVISFSARA